MLRVFIMITLILFWDAELCNSGRVSLSLSQAGASIALELGDRVPPVTSSPSLGCRASSHCCQNGASSLSRGDGCSGPSSFLALLTAPGPGAVQEGHNLSITNADKSMKKVRKAVTSLALIEILGWVLAAGGEELSLQQGCVPNHVPKVPPTWGTLQGCAGEGLGGGCFVWVGLGEGEQ